MKKMICLLLALCMFFCCAAAEEFALPVLTAQLGQAAVQLDYSEQNDEYMQVLMVDEATVMMGRWFGEKTAEELAMMFADDLRDGELLADGEGGVDERAVFLFDQPDQAYAIDATVIHMDGYTYGMAVVVGENAYFGYVSDEPFSAQVDFWVETLDVFDGDFAAEEAGANVMLLFDHPLYNEAELVAYDDLGDMCYSMELQADGGNLRIFEYALPCGDVVEDLEGMLLAVAQRSHPDAANIQWVQDDSLTAQLEGWPAYIVTWESADVECRAMAVLADKLLVVAAAAEQLPESVDEMFASAQVFAMEAEYDISGVQAEEIGYALFGEYGEFIYLWDEEIDGFDYCVYEFYDVDGDIIGALAVRPDTGDALVSFGAEAIEPVYEPVYYTEADGYHVAPSVG